MLSIFFFFFCIHIMEIGWILGGGKIGGPESLSQRREVQGFKGQEIILKRKFSLISLKMILKN